MADSAESVEADGLIDRIDKDAGMSQAAKVQEPSMEEILASIRRIIADDEAAKPPVKASEPPATAANLATDVRLPAAPPPQPEPMGQDDIDAMLEGFDTGPGGVEAEAAKPRTPAEAEVLDLTEAMEARAAPAAPRHGVEVDTDIVFADPPPREPPRQERPAFQAAPPPIAEPIPASAQTLLSDQATAAVTSAFGSLAHTVLVQNARTLDDLVRDMLRPMLKSWLDDNLPTIVERLVRAEIERVSRGRG